MENNEAKEIDLIQIVIPLWNYRKWIAIGTGVVTLIGLVYALFATPVYYSEAIIAPKEPQKSNGAASMLSQLGGLGGMVASQFGLGNTNLDKMEIITKGRVLAESVIVRNNLMPILYADRWDSVKGRWSTSDTNDIPKMRDAIEMLRKDNLQVTVDDKINMIMLGVNYPDPVWAKKITEYYLTALNDKLKNDIIADAEQNRIYLLNQLNNTTDPLIQEKIQNMIAFEIEKSMLVSSFSIEILEKPVVPLLRKSPNRKLIVIVSGISGFLFSIGAILLFYLAKGWRSQVLQYFTESKR
ncbi:MAG: hypothetical protein A2293_14785 [Elusimicrobia bacterium RIFOXYB2_FULL_49_7]|nr:MAG: hypothetical protein A2293_14785 [Elusimicrobia bacterium RIFOXYB2_FULL_49_7]